MPFSTDYINELNVLVRYNLSTTQEGIKVHANADAEVISATERLHNKGLLSQIDGGYLTELGRESAEHAQALLTILKA